MPRAPAPASACEALDAGAVEQVVAVEVQQVEEVRRDARRRCPGRCGTRSPGTAAAARRRRARAPRRRGRTARRAAPRATSTTSGSRSVMSSRLRVATRTSSPSRWTWIRMPSSLASTATGAAAGLGHRGGDVGRAGGEHRQHRPADLEPDRGQRLLARERRAGDRDGAAGEHRRTAYGRQRHPGGRGHRLLDQGVERALPDAAGEHAAQPGLLVGGGPAEQVGHRGPRARLRAGAARGAAIAVERLVHLGAPSGRARRQGRAGAPTPRQPEAGAPLPQRAAEVGRRPSRARRARPRRRHLGQRGDLGLARAGGRRRRRRSRRPRRAAPAHSVRGADTGDTADGRLAGEHDRFVRPPLQRDARRRGARLRRRGRHRPAGDRGRGRDARRDLPAGALAR